MGIIEKCSHYHIEKLRKKMIKFVEWIIVSLVNFGRKIC
jgi:hypothetical protein